MDRLIVRLILLTCAGSAGICSAASKVAPFDAVLKPFVGKYCGVCHNDKVQSGGLNLVNAQPSRYDIWDKVEGKLRASAMPPRGLPQPATRESDAAIAAIETQLTSLERNQKPEPGKVAARRLNRFEYSNTIRDLLGVRFAATDEFPADDAGYGFDNIGDVLTVSPVLMEKYMSAAREIAERAIVVTKVPEAAAKQYKIESGDYIPVVEAKHDFPVDGDYDLTVSISVTRPGGAASVRRVQLVVSLDDRELKRFDVDTRPLMPRIFEFRTRVPAGDRPVKAVFEEEPVPEAVRRQSRTSIEYLELKGPFKASPPQPNASHKRIFICGDQTRECARRILTELSRRAFRRPVTADDVNPRLRLLDLAKEHGSTFEEGIQLALESILVSPDFLFRIEKTPASAVGGFRRLNDFELASRLSYFLWSSMPDEELFSAAQNGTLKSPAVLRNEVRRMLADSKSEALVESFAGQWLQIRNLQTQRPDPVRFPGFDEDLRSAMMQETQMFFRSIIQEDRSILDLIDARYTFLNERLARHYGISGVLGKEFRRVELTGDQRGGILTQASVLTVTSYPNRTSPVLRGKWLLQNILGAPSPPPPPDVPNLNEAEIGSKASLRQQLEKHRASPACAVCHSRMDPLGFGLENYDAIGAWRTTDGNFPVDSSGVLPDGRSFGRPSELKEILMSEKDAFTATLAEKLLTYALGRGIENYDRAAVKSIARRTAEGQYRFSRLTDEIVSSVPFQMTKTEGTNKPGVRDHVQISSKKNVP